MSQEADGYAQKASASAHIYIYIGLYMHTYVMMQ